MGVKKEKKEGEANGGATREKGDAKPKAAGEEAEDKGMKPSVSSKSTVRLPKPDRSAIDAQIAALNDSIEAQQLRITEVRQAIESKRGNRKSMNGDVQNVRNELVQVRSEFKRELVRPSRARAHVRASGTRRARGAGGPRPLLARRSRPAAGRSEFGSADGVAFVAPVFPRRKSSRTCARSSRRRTSPATPCATSSRR